MNKRAPTPAYAVGALIAAEAMLLAGCGGGSSQTSVRASSSVTPGAMAAARDAYREYASQTNASLAPIRARMAADLQSGSTDDRVAATIQYAATLKAGDARLAAIQFPASVQPVAQAVLADDARIETGAVKVANATCAQTCTLFEEYALFFQQHDADVAQLRSLLGLAPALTPASASGTP